MELSKLTLAIILFVCALFLVHFFRKLKNTQDELKALIDQRFEGKTIYLHDRLALLIAQKSRGYSQRQGNGNLILTDDELFFTMTIPKTILSIPLKSITSIERPLRMNGQCILKKLLKVNFTTETGEDEAIGWHVKELNRWEEEIMRRKN